LPNLLFTGILSSRQKTVVSKDFILKILDAASMQRWNDKIRPVDLRELDKQAH